MPSLRELKLQKSTWTVGIFLVKTGAKVIIDYAHTPDAYDKILSTLKSVLTKRIIYIWFLALEEREIVKKDQKWLPLLRNTARHVL